MNQKGNSVIGNQSIVPESVNEGVRKDVTEGAIEDVFEDLSVQDAEMIKGGPSRPAGGGGGGDIVVWDIVDSLH